MILGALSSSLRCSTGLRRWKQLQIKHSSSLYHLYQLRPFSNMGFQTVNTTERLAKLRELMSQQEYNVDAYVIPSEDQRECIDLLHYS
jgi:hypothetical protein